MIEWPESKIHAFQKTLLDWYDHNKRDLPWRRDHDPYHVWISEIMLQQTQVHTVIPYYERFMAEFPSVADLANADEGRLMKAWEGLGYYSRARNLQKAARQIVQDYDNVWPRDIAELQKLAGIGPYTAGAIASIAFNQPVPAVDGNAFRVFSRLLEIDDEISKPQTRKIFEQVISKIISQERPGDFNQAIMDLGSSYMTAANPNSAHSPVKAFDQSYIDGVELNYPVKNKKPRPIEVDYFALVIRSSAGILMEKRPDSGILADFWTFPLVAKEDLLAFSGQDEFAEDDDALTAMTDYFAQQYGLTLAFQFLPVKKVTHIFTHRKWLMTLLSADLTTENHLSLFSGRFFSKEDFIQHAFPKVQQKLIDQVNSLDE
ncbi:MAG: A/G-specific adenine glycosylase [Oenococcus sp.]|uniref:A/G-specific adenine glycosylase n=1 Tax=Oenococcus sp. TaxID=1979414 RepID=UPI0039EB0401